MLRPYTKNLPLSALTPALSHRERGLGFPRTRE